jgi:DNA-binding transcriptional regulator YiaG
MTPVVTTASATEATVTAAPAVAKAPSKKSQALAIFAAKMVERTQGLYASNKDFRAAVLRAIETDLSVSTASAATMYNAAKAEAEKADSTVALGRDPKKVKVKSESGKRGRPAGSKNKAKEVVEAAPAEATAEAVAA